MVNSLPTGKPYSRLDAFPLDNSSIFETLEAAEAYAQSSPIAYHTQIIGVISEDAVYMIAADKTLISLIGGEGTDPANLVLNKIKLGEDIELLGTSLGGLDEGDELGKNTTLLEFVRRMTQKRIPPVYVLPALELSMSQETVLEVGTPINNTLTPVFHQNDAGVLSEYSITIDGEEVHVELGLGTYTWEKPAATEEGSQCQAVATYESGPVKNDNMGEPSPANAVTTGTVLAEKITVRGKRAVFYGADQETDMPETSAQVRALAQSNINFAKGDTIPLNLPVGTRRIVIALPASLGTLDKVRYVEQGNADYLDLFTLEMIQVEGANGYTAVSYNVYTWITAVPIGSPMTLMVTL